MRSGSASWPSSTRPRSVRECGQSSQAVIFDGVTSRSFGLFIRTPVVCNRSTPNFRPKAVDPRVAEVQSSDTAGTGGIRPRLRLQS